MKKSIFRHIFTYIIALNFIACSSSLNGLDSEQIEISKDFQYLKSGTISISFDLNNTEKKLASALNHSDNIDFFQEEFLKLSRFTDNSTACLSTEILTPLPSNVLKQKVLPFAPLVGFFPLSIAFKPADNEVWIQILRDKNQIEVFKGQELIKSIQAEGKISLAPGEYPLQHKQRNPLWYAPDEYFSRRELRVPPRGDHFRYRRGALGNYAVYPTMDFAIHSGPFWSEEVGGLKVSETDLASIFVMLNVGTPIVVK